MASGMAVLTDVTGKHAELHVEGQDSFSADILKLEAQQRALPTPLR
jgi:hypothetical protein